MRGDSMNRRCGVGGASASTRAIAWPANTRDFNGFLALGKPCAAVAALCSPQRSKLSHVRLELHHVNKKKACIMNC